MVRAANWPNNLFDDDDLSQLSFVSSRKLSVSSSVGAQKVVRPNAPLLLRSGGLETQFRKFALEGSQQHRQLRLTPRRCSLLETKQPKPASESTAVVSTAEKSTKVTAAPSDGDDWKNRTIGKEIHDTVNDKHAVTPSTRVSVSSDSSSASDSSSFFELKTASSDSAPASGHGVHPKFLTIQAFRSKTTDDSMKLAETLKAIGEVCTPLCSPRRLDRRLRNRSKKRMQAELQARAKPCMSVLHPPCVVSGAVYSAMAAQMRQRHKQNLRDLYQQQLEKEVNRERFYEERGCQPGVHRSAHGKRPVTRKSPSKPITGKFSNEEC